MGELVKVVLEGALARERRACCWGRAMCAGGIGQAAVGDVTVVTPESLVEWQRVAIVLKREVDQGTHCFYSD